MSRRTVVFLLALAAVITAVVVRDVLAPRPEPAVRPAVPATDESEPPPSLTRGLSRAALVYPGEFASSLAARLRPSLAVAEPAGDPAGVEPAVVLGNRTALIAAGASVGDWTVRLDGRSVPATLAGADAVHGVALLRLQSEAPTPGIAVQAAGPAAPEPLVAMRPQRGMPAMQYLAASSLPLRARVARLSIEPGDTIVDLDGQMAGFVGRTAEGAIGLDAPLVREIAAALDETGRHAHPWLGADLQTITPALRPRFASGAIAVVFVDAASAAARAGLRAGQTFDAARIGDRRFTTAEALEERLRAGDVVQFERGAGAGLEVEASDLQAPRHGAADPRGLWTRTEPGVPVIVVPGSEAARAGLTTGDRIEAIDLKPARPATVTQLLERRLPGLLTIERDDRRRFVWLPAPPLASSAAAAPAVRATP